MYSLRPGVWVGIALGLGSLSTAVPAQAAPTAAAKTTSALTDKKADKAKKSDKKAQILPVLIGSGALFTLVPAEGGTDPLGLTGAAVGGTTPGTLSGVTATPATQSGAAHPGVTSVPETAPWVAFALTGLGSVGLALRARKRLAKMPRDAFFASQTIDAENCS